MIKEGIEILNTAFTRAVGDGKYIVLYLISLLFLFIYLKEKEKKTALLTYSIVSIIILFNPISAYFIGKIINQGSNVYWRTFWTIPIGFSIAYMFTEIVFMQKNKYKKIIVAISSIVIIIFSGTIIYQKTVFQKVNNLYKIPDDELLAINIILEEAKNAGIDNPKVLVPPELVAYVRQIDSKILMDYFRNPTGGYGFHPILNSIFEKNHDEAIKSMIKNNFNYLIWQKNIFDNNTYLKLVNSTANYNIYEIITE